MKLQKNQTDNTFNNVASIPPTITDDKHLGYDVGSSWWDKVGTTLYECEDATVGAAVWVAVPQGSGGSGTVTNVATGTGLTGGPISTTGTVALDTKLAPLDSLTGNSLKIPRVNAGETALEYVTAPAGTVTAVSIATANGFSGSSSGGATPALTIIAGDITPSKVTTPQTILTANPITASTNAATIPITSKNNIVTNDSAATLTITLATASALNMQDCIVQILDFSNVAQTLVFVNTEDSLTVVPATSNGSTTLPLTVGFKFNSLTSKWRCVAFS